jgi:hypothetical protein
LVLFFVSLVGRQQLLRQLWHSKHRLVERLHRRTTSFNTSAGENQHFVPNEHPLVKIVVVTIATTPLREFPQTLIAVNRLYGKRLRVQAFEPLLFISEEMDFETHGSTATHSLQVLINNDRQKYHSHRQ